MKTINTSKTIQQRQPAGFTLIEMIGVLAVIAILAALLVPKVTSAISDARVNNTVSSYQAVQAAAASHYAKYNSFNVITNTTIAAAAFPILNWDSAALLPEGFLDSPFGVKVGNGCMVQVVAGAGNSTTGYKLDGVNNLTANNAWTVECVVSNVTAQDAFDVASKIDGALVGTNVVGNNLLGGRVVWTTPINGLANMYMYVAGR